MKKINHNFLNAEQRESFIEIGAREWFGQRHVHYKVDAKALRDMQINDPTVHSVVVVKKKEVVRLTKSIG